MAGMLDRIGRAIARYLERPVQSREASASSYRAGLRSSFQPGDALLVEGDSRISRTIKYLPPSTWAHAALHVGPIGNSSACDGEPHVLVEDETGEGVISAPRLQLLETRDAADHRVLYVLGFGTAGAIVTNALVFVYFALFYTSG
jgi:hypothetical protein